MALLTVFSDNLDPENGSLTARFTNATAFYIDAPLLGAELEIDAYLQVYFPTAIGERVRNLPLGKLKDGEIKLNEIDSISVETIGFGLMWFLIGCGWSISRAKSYQLELAQYKLAVGQVLSGVRKVSDTLERGAQTSTIAPAQKREIQQLTQDATAVLEQVESNIELETEKLIHLVEE